MHKREVVVLSGVRTAVGSYGGSLKDQPLVDLAAAVVRESLKSGATCEAATKIGSLIASRAKEQGIGEVVFDRGGYLFHGRVRALANGAREEGLIF